jgi:type IV secretory pathway VirB3-like protein
MTEAEPVEDDLLFLACTRPTVVPIPFVNVPVEMLVANLVASILIFVILGRGNPAYLLAFVLFHFPMRAACAHDHNFVRIAFLYVTTRLPTMGRWLNVSEFAASRVRPYETPNEVRGG